MVDRYKGTNEKSKVTVENAAQDLCGGSGGMAEDGHESSQLLCHCQLSVVRYCQFNSQMRRPYFCANFKLSHAHYF